MERKYSRIALMCIFSAFLAGSALAQQETGNINGTVSADGGDTLPGVTISATGKYLFGERAAVSDENGRYSLRNLPNGEYDVTFVMPGFKTVKRTGVRVQIGQTTNLNATLPVSSVQEVLTVTSNEPLVDTTNANQGDNFNAEDLSALPTTNDPWSILEVTPGVYMSQNNIGGNKQGTQARFGAHGTSPYQNAYYVDGINLTDTSASGASGQYYDYDTFEAVQVSTASHDASVGAPGVAINMVTKTGSNEFEAKASYGYSSEAWQSNNSIIRDGDGAVLSSPQDYNRDLNINFRGPIVKDKLWFFVAHHDNKVNLYTPNTNKALSDLTELEQTNANLKWAVNDSHTVKVAYNENNKSKSNRLPTWPSSSYYQGAGLGWAQDGPGDAWYIQDEWFVNDALTFNFKYGQQSFPFTLGQPGDAAADVLTRYPVHVNNGNGTATSAYSYPVYDRSNDTFTAKGNYFRTIGASSHDFSFGIDYLASENLTDDNYPGNAIVYQDDATQGEIWFYRPVFTTNETSNTAFYLNDVITLNKWTFNVGLRYQVQNGTINAGMVEGTWQNVPAELGVRNGQTFADRFATVTSPELSDVAEWKDLLPRFSVTYDLNADGRTLFKVGLNQYAHTMNNDEFELASPLSELEEDYPWEDKDGNGLFLGDGTDWDEVDFDTLLWSAGGGSGTEIADGYEAPITDEAIFNFSHQFANNMALSTSVIYRKTSNMTYTRQNGAAGLENWEATTFTDAEGTVHDTWEYVGSGVTSQIRTNLDDYETEYTGFEVTLGQRGKNYSYNASFTTGSIDVSYNLDELNTPNEAETLLTGRRFSNDYAGEWTARLYGSYTLPYDIQASAKVRIDSGSYYNVFEQFNDGLTTSSVLINGRETDHLPSYEVFDIGFARTFTMGNAGNLELKVDIYNLFNSDTIVAYRSANIQSSVFEQPAEILGPRVARINISYIY
ncbi:MAG: TonB-dependent receptor [Acidobacteriota bacterium]|nr:TonB-dependent receptor [Acidobacteriota bacterium]